MNNQKTQHFFRNNYKMQTILLVIKLLKQFRYLTIRACWGRFWAICTRFPVAPVADVDCPRSTGMEIEFTGLEFHVQKSSPVDSSFAYGNQVHWTRVPSVVPPQCCSTWM